MSEQKPWYLAGPMRGYPDFNIPAFRSAAAHARACGYDIISPVEINLGSSLDLTESLRATYIRRDVEAVLSSQGVLVLDGWESSRGATLEVEIARQLDLPVLSVYSFLPV